MEIVDIFKQAIDKSGLPLTFILEDEKSIIRINYPKVTLWHNGRSFDVPGIPYLRVKVCNSFVCGLGEAGCDYEDVLFCAGHPHTGDYPYAFCTHHETSEALNKALLFSRFPIDEVANVLREVLGVFCTYSEGRAYWIPQEFSNCSFCSSENEIEATCKICGRGVCRFCNTKGYCPECYRATRVCDACNTFKGHSNKCIICGCKLCDECNGYSGRIRVTKIPGVAYSYTLCTRCRQEFFNGNQ